ncbi:FAD:protein FMN transferase [Hyphomicrobium sp. MC8b]|uniref:FAD:protein FMN transferase n=1 Tax=Hyphomicrobium sp. MC8b TaxID=300273 RepID=UPI003919064B
MKTRHRKASDDATWSIGIADPFGSSTALAALFVTGGGIATSGTYERWRTSRVMGQRVSFLDTKRLRSTIRIARSESESGHPVCS